MFKKLSDMIRNEKFRGTKPCVCPGPNPGEPVCPCRMKNVKVIDGRYVEVIDHGPAPMLPISEEKR